MGSHNQEHPLVWQAAFRRSVPVPRFDCVSAPSGADSLENTMWMPAQ
jgi:hypothetical protein